jgi:hypothetical protein
MATNGNPPPRRNQQDSMRLSDALAVLQSSELLMHTALKNGQVRFVIHGPFVPPEEILVAYCGMRAFQVRFLLSHSSDTCTSLLCKVRLFIPKVCNLVVLPVSLNQDQEELPAQSLSNH